MDRVSGHGAAQQRGKHDTGADQPAPPIQRPHRLTGVTRDALDDRTAEFIAQGVPCLRAGLLHAIPASLAAWWILRRGFAVKPVAAGLATGTLAGLAGVAMLELHCPNFEAPHLMVWHIAVIPVSAALVALAAIGVQAFESRRKNRNVPG